MNQLPEKKTITYELDVQEDTETGECYIQLTEEMCQLSGFNEGDILEWTQDDESDSIILRKVEQNE